MQLTTYRCNKRGKRNSLTKRVRKGELEFRKTLFLFSFSTVSHYYSLLKSFLEYWELFLPPQTLVSPCSNKEVFSSICIILMYTPNVVAAFVITYTAHGCYRDTKKLSTVCFWVLTQGEEPALKPNFHRMWT